MVTTGGPIQHSAQLDAARFTRRAWWSLVGFVASFALAFLIGEGLVSALGYPVGGPEQAPVWVALVATVPALVVFCVPAAFAVYFGTRARRLGDDRAVVPMAVGLVVAAGFVAMNVLSGIVTWLA